MLRQLWVLVLSVVAVIFGGLSDVTAQVVLIKIIGTNSSTSAATATSITVPPAGVAVGNRIIVMLALNPASGGVSCSDSGANSYVVDRNVRNGSGMNGVRIVILSAHVTTALTNGHIITCTHPNVAARALSAIEFSGLLAVAAVDRKNSDTGSSATPSSGTTAKTTQAAELLIGGIGVEGAASESFTPGPGYAVVGRAGTSGGVAANNVTINPAYQIVSAIGAYSSSGTLGASRRWAAAIITYKAAPAVASKLAITSVNSGVNPTAGVGFPVVVQAQDNAGAPRNVTADTGIALTLKAGTGSLGGTLTGTISAGTNQVTITGATYTKAESGVIITAARSSGDNLSSGDSAGITVNPGAATKLAFTVQPGNSTAGSPISGPPTISVQDTLGNTVTTSTASITLAIAANPGGGILNGTTTKSAGSGVALFTGLSITHPGNGYTLSATSSGLTSATSSAFDVTAASVTLSATPASVPAGDSFNVTWAQIPNPTIRDWIGLYAPGSSDTSYIDYRYVNCNSSPTVIIASGSCSFPISPSRPPGTYEFRLFPNDTYNRIATSNPVTVTAAINKLALSVNQNVTAGTPGFSMTVESKSPFGIATNVSTDTTITVSVKTGTGNLGGTVSGTILAGTSQITIGLATYTKAESGVVLTAARTSGDMLISGDTVPFTVQPGPAARLAFTTQPGNAAVNSPIPGPPTVTIEDSTGNTVTASTQSISIAIGTNPSGGALDGNTTVSSSSSVTFADLTIDQPGNGYTLTVSAPGLAGATSNLFNITSSTGTGIIAGVITRVSNGATIAGALVEAFQGTALRGTAVSNSTGNYSITGLSAGSYTVRASFTGLVPQIFKNVLVANGNTITVDLGLNFGIAIQSPIAGTVINEHSVLVSGMVDTLLGEVGINVNGYIAVQNGDEFATIVPLEATITNLTASVTTTTGTTLAEHNVPITVQPPSSEPVLNFRPSPAIAFVTEPVSFTLTSLNPINQVQLDGNGDGTVDFTGATLDGTSVTFAEPGLYYPTVAVSEPSGALRSITTLIQVLDMVQLDVMLTTKWNAMKNALRSGNTAAAADYIVKSKRASYQNVFNSLIIPLANIDQVLTNITYSGQRGLNIEYEMLRVEGGTSVSYMVVFVLDDDGVWRIKFF